MDAIRAMLGSASAEIASDEPLTLDNVTRVLDPLLAPKAGVDDAERLRVSLGDLAGQAAVDGLAVQVAAAQPVVEAQPCRCATCAGAAGEICGPHPGEPLVP